MLLLKKSKMPYCGGIKKIFIAWHGNCYIIYVNIKEVLFMKKLLLILISGLFFLAACAQAPDAEIGADKDSVTRGTCLAATFKVI
jgi:hypothetical protein